MPDNTLQIEKLLPMTCTLEHHVGLGSYNMQAYSLLRSAAGLLQFVKEKCAPLLANICPSLDCNSQVRYEHPLT